MKEQRAAASGRQEASRDDPSSASGPRSQEASSSGLRGQPPGGRVPEITVAAQRDAFDLPACRELLDQHGIVSVLSGRGFNQVVLVARTDSGRALELIACHREGLIRVNPLSAGDYVLGIMAWSFGCGMAIPALLGLLLIYLRIDTTLIAIAAGVALAGSIPLGGCLGYWRCRSIASRRRRSGSG